MTHRYKKKAPSTAMYRHFAVITVVCTGLLAVFADGEKAKAVTEQVEQERPENEAKNVENVGAIAEMQQPGGVWGSDVAAAAGTGSLSQQVNMPNFSAAFGGNLLARYSPDYLGRLSAREREDLMRAMAENGADGTGLADARAASLERQSRMRSGSLGIE